MPELGASALSRPSRDQPMVNGTPVLLAP